MIETLLERGADPNFKSLPFYPIFFAVKCGDYEMLKLLLEKGASPEVKLSKKVIFIFTYNTRQGCNF